MPTSLTSISGIGPAAAEVLKQHGFKAAEDIANATIAELSAVPGFGEIRSKNTIQSAIAVVSPVTKSEASSEDAVEPVKEKTKKKTKGKKKPSKDKKSKGKKDKDKKKSKGKVKKKKDKKKGKKKKK